MEGVRCESGKGYVVTATEDGLVILNSKTGGKLHTVKLSHNATPTSIAYSRDIIIVGDDKGWIPGPYM